MAVIPLAPADGHLLGIQRLRRDDLAGGLGTITSISAGGLHTCALDDSAKVTCWGDQQDDRIAVPSNLGTVRQSECMGSEDRALANQRFMNDS